MSVICAGGCGTTVLGKAQADRVVENEVVHIGWLHEVTMIGIFARTICGANRSGRAAIYVPRAIKVF